MLRPSTHGAHAGPVPEMGDNDAGAGGGPGMAGQDAGDVFIGKAVKAVAPHPFFGQGARQGIGRDQRRIGVVEGGVETGDLRQPRGDLGEAPYGREIMGLMQGRQGHQCLQFGKHVGACEHWRAEPGAAMHHAMSGRDQRMVPGVALDPLHHHLQEACVIRCGRQLTRRRRLHRWRRE